MPLKGLDKLNGAIDDLVESANDDVKGVYFAGLKNIIEGTPARSGLTRNSWFLTTDSPSAAERKQARISGSASINQVVNNMPKTVLGKTLYFTNNSPPINLLEYGGYPNAVMLGTWIDGKYQKLSSGGYSKQTPGGWVRKNLKLMEAKIRTL